MKKYLLILVILSLISVFSLFHKGFFQSDDGEWMIIRFSAFHQALRDGEFPVRLLGRLNYGYGYPVANFLYPGFMYLSEIPKILGFGFVNSIKIMLGLSMLTSSIFVFLWLSKFFGKLESLLGAVFYLYAPYHLYDIYRRGSVGEVLALAIVPFVLWQIDRGSFFWLTLGIGALLISHNTLAFLFFLFIILYMALDVVLAYEKRKLFYNYAVKILLGVGLSMFFWLPAIYDLKYTNFYKVEISNFQNYFAKPELIGFSLLAVLILSLIPFIFNKVEIVRHRLTLLMFAVVLLSLFFASSFSLPLWSFLPVSFIQFPFRFLSLAMVCVSFLAAFFVSTLKKEIKIWGFLLILLLIPLSSWTFITPSLFFDKGEGFYATNEGTTTVQDEYMPKWVKEKPTQHFGQKIEIVNGKADIVNVKYNSKEISFSINSKGASLIRMNTIYFPGWSVKVDSKAAPISYENKRGVMDIHILSGAHVVKAVSSTTAVHFIGDFISLFSLFTILILEIKNRALNK